MLSPADAACAAAPCLSRRARCSSRLRTSARLRRRDVTAGRRCRHSHARLRAGSQETFNRLRAKSRCPDRICCLAVPADSRPLSCRAFQTVSAVSLCPLTAAHLRPSFLSRMFVKTKAIDAIARDFLRTTLYLREAIAVHNETPCLPFTTKPSRTQIAVHNETLENADRRSQRNPSCS